MCDFKVEGLNFYKDSILIIRASHLDDGPEMDELWQIDAQGETMIFRKKKDEEYNLNAVVVQDDRIFIQRATMWSGYFEEIDLNGNVLQTFK